MKTKQGWRKGIGLAQIMALLLVVLPTMVFIITLLLDYWTVMQADYKLKLIANLSSQYANGKEDVTDLSDIDAQLISRVNAQNLCPNGKSLSLKSSNTNGLEGQIVLSVEYVHNGPYIQNKTIRTNMLTYSYHDQNLTAVFVCQ